MFCKLVHFSMLLSTYTNIISIYFHISLQFSILSFVLYLVDFKFLNAVNFLLFPANSINILAVKYSNKIETSNKLMKVTTYCFVLFTNLTHESKLLTVFVFCLPT